jgi:hypothetical protein
MTVIYSTIDTIDEYEILFHEFHIKYTTYSVSEINHNLIYLAAGLGLSNSIHEKFIKCIIEDYIRINRLSNTKKKKLINSYKAPNKIKDFVTLLGLDLVEAFDLMKLDIQANYSHIDSFYSVIAVISDQRNIRNDYLHGDFNILDEIDLSVFQENIIDFQKIHNFLFKMIRYSFLKNITSLPDISLSI